MINDATKLKTQSEIYELIYMLSLSVSPAASEEEEDSFCSCCKHQCWSVCGGCEVVGQILLCSDNKRCECLSASFVLSWWFHMAHTICLCPTCFSWLQEIRVLIWCHVFKSIWIFLLGKQTILSKRISFLLYAEFSFLCNICSSSLLIL